MLCLHTITINRYYTITNQSAVKICKNNTMFRFFNLHNRLSITFLQQYVHTKRIFKGTENILILEKKEKYFFANHAIFEIKYISLQHKNLIFE